MGENPEFLSVLRGNDCETGDLATAWKNIWDKYDSKKPAYQSKLANDFANCVQTIPGGAGVDNFINRLNTICSKMEDSPGESLKKTQVVKGIDEKFYVFAHAESLREMSWSDFCVSVRDHATQLTDIMEFRKRKINSVLTASSESAATNEGDDLHAMLADWKKQKKFKTNPGSKIRCYECGEKGHKKFKCPKLEKEKKKKKKKKMRDQRDLKKPSLRWTSDSESNADDGSDSE